MSGKVWIIGLGPGSLAVQTPQAAEALRQASDLVGYGPYVERAPEISVKRYVPA